MRILLYAYRVMSIVNANHRHHTDLNQNYVVEASDCRYDCEVALEASQTRLLRSRTAVVVAAVVLDQEARLVTAVNWPGAAAK